jgi:hypothetical protein
MTKYKAAMFIFAIIIPFLFCILWITIAEVVPMYYKQGVIVYVAEIVPDLIRTSGYVILEILAIVIRMLVYRTTANIVSSAHYVKHSVAARKRDEKLRVLQRQLTLYTMPFIFFGVWIIIMRTYLDSWYTNQVVRNGIENFTTADISFTGHILTGLQRIFTPMKVLMNAVVYGVLTKWFKQRLIALCCGSPKSATSEAESDDEARVLVM